LSSKSSAENQYQGNISSKIFRHREQQYQYMSKHAHQHQGNIKARSLKGKENYYKRLSKKAHQSDGTREVSKFRYMILKIFKPREVKNVKKPSEKPKYDSREHEIWYY
jgi:hypothetical protein